MLWYPRIPQGLHHRRSTSCWLSRSTCPNVPNKAEARASSPCITISESAVSLSQKKAKVMSLISVLYYNMNAASYANLIVVNCLFFMFQLQSLGPEFSRMIDEPQIVLELPGSIVVNCISVVLVTLYNELRLKAFSTSFQLYCILRLQSLCLCIFIFFSLSLSIDTVEERQVRLLSKRSLRDHAK